MRAVSECLTRYDHISSSQVLPHRVSRHTSGIDGGLAMEYLSMQKKRKSSSSSPSCCQIPLQDSAPSHLCVQSCCSMAIAERPAEERVKSCHQNSVKHHEQQMPSRDIFKHRRHAKARQRLSGRPELRAACGGTSSGGWRRCAAGRL